MKTLFWILSGVLSTDSIDLVSSIKKLDKVKELHTTIINQSESFTSINIIARKMDFIHSKNKLVELYNLEKKALKHMGQVDDGKQYLATFTNIFNKYVQMDVIDQVVTDILSYILMTNKILCEVMPINTSVDTEGKHNQNYLLLQNIPVLIEIKRLYLTLIESSLSKSLFSQSLLGGKFDYEVESDYDLLDLIVEMTKESYVALQKVEKIGRDLIEFDARQNWPKLKWSYDQKLRYYLSGCTKPSSIYNNIEQSFNTISDYRKKGLTHLDSPLKFYPLDDNLQILILAHLSYLQGTIVLFTNYLKFIRENFYAIITNRKLNQSTRQKFFKLYRGCRAKLDYFGGSYYNYNNEILETVRDKMARDDLKKMVYEIWNQLYDCRDLTLQSISMVIDDGSNQPYEKK